MTAADVYRPVSLLIPRPVRNIGFLSVPRATFLCMLCMLCALAAMQPGAALAREAANGDAAVPASRPQTMLLAMGGKPAQTAGEEADRAEPANGIGRKQPLQGSFLGAVLFGSSYEGVGAVDLAVIAVALLLLVRIAARRKAKTGKDGFTIQRGDAPTEIPDKFNRTWDTREPKHDTGDSGTSARPGLPSSADQAPDRGSGDSRQHRLEEQRPDDSDAKPLEGPQEKGPGADTRPGPHGQQPAPQTMKDRAALMWQYYENGESAPDGRAPTQWGAVASGVEVPQNFDVADFLEGARTLYIRLQKAWAARNVDELEPFVSARLLDLLKSQAARDPYPVQVDILLVEAELADVRRLEDREEAAVNFSVSMRSGSEPLPQDVRELWRFTRSPGSGGMWRLEGIEQP